MELSVSGLAVRVVLDLGTFAGVDAAAVLRRLNLPDSAIEPLRPLPWSRYVDLLEEVSRTLGGDAALRKASERFVDAVPDFAPIARQFLTPSAVMQFVILVVDPVVYPMIDHHLEVLGNGRFRVHIQLRPGHRPARAYFEASAGALTGMPRYLGLEAATVEADVHETGGTYLVRFPPQQEVTVADVPLGADHPTLALMQRMGLAVLQQLDHQHRLAATLRQTTRALDAVVEEILATVPNAAFVYSPQDGVRGANDKGRTMIDRDAGLTETLRRAVHSKEAQSPWSVMDLLHGRHLLISRGSDTDVRARLGRIATLWRLTPRQADVLALVVQGHSNKEIARALGCATKTVEIHLSHLLQKAGVESRLALLSTFWAHSEN